MKDNTRIAIACGFVAVLVSLGAVIPALESGGGLSALVRLPAEEALGQLVQSENPDFNFVAPETRYDGLYFYAFALDPFATGDEHRLIDAPSYRYGHAGYGWAAAVLSLGNNDLVPFVLLLLSLAGMAVAAGAASVLGRMLGTTPWIGLAVAVNPGLIYAVTADTSEAFAAAILGLGLIYWLRGNLRAGGILLISLCLIKEPFVMVPAGLAAWELVEWRRGRRAPDLWRRAGWLAAGPLALAAWFVYLEARFQVWPFSDGPQNLAAPITGWIDTLGRAADMSLDPGGSQIGAASLPLLLGVAGVLIVGVVFASRLRTALDSVFIGLVLVIASLSWLALLYPKDMMRNVSTAFYVLPFVFLASRGPMVESVSSTTERDPG